MTRSLIYAAGALAIAIVIGVSYVLNFGLYPRFFDIEWDEEVQFHDGRVIVVHVKNSYERQRATLERYEETAIVFRQKEVTFELESGLHTFRTRMPLAYLGQFGKRWYVVISGQGPYGNHPDEMPTHWGNDFTKLEQRLAVFQDGAFRPIRWEDAPPLLARMNLLPSAFRRELLSWSGSRVTLAQKKNFEDSNPVPNPLTFALPIRMDKTKGAKE